MKLRLFFAGMFLSSVSCFASQTPRYIFFFIGDGMGMGAVSLAQDYKRMVLDNDTLLTMMRFPIASAAFTHSASSPVTDSAAAGTALASGNKTNNGMLGVTPDSTAVISIAQTLHDNGFGIGLVTTVAPDDATPGAFYAHQPSRAMFYEIGKDAASSGYEFMAGANLRGLKDANGNVTDLLKVFDENKVSVVRGLSGLSDISNRKVLLLNTDTIHDNDVGFAIDSIAGVLTLPAMTKACMEHLLAYTPDRFFMMVEGGSIDHAGHANDAATVVIETLNFDNALRQAYDFYLLHPEETLIVVTADHETGGLCLGNRKLYYNIEPKYLQYQKMSKDAFNESVGMWFNSRMVITWDDMQRFLAENLGLYSHIPVEEAQDAKLREDFDLIISVRNSATQANLSHKIGAFADNVYGVVSLMSGIGWTTGNHSGAVVPVYAIGVGAEQFAPMQDNTEIPVKILRIAGF